MVYLLYTIFFLACITLVASVLLQPGKTDAGALFTSNISSTAFQPRGAQSILSKISIIAAIVFMLSALFLSLPALTGNVSVLQTAGDATNSPSPALDGNTNAAANDANANSNAAAANSDANQANSVSNTSGTNINAAPNVKSVTLPPRNANTTNNAANK